MKSVDFLSSNKESVPENTITYFINAEHSCLAPTVMESHKTASVYWKCNVQNKVQVHESDFKVMRAMQINAMSVNYYYTQYIL